MISLNDTLLTIICRSLKLEVFHSNRTLLQPCHCPNGYLVQGLPGINQYVRGRVSITLKDQEPVEIREGEAIFLPPHVPIKCFNHSPNQTISVWHAMRFTILDAIDPLDLLNPVKKFDLKVGERIGEINQTLHELEALRQRNFLDYVAKRHLCAMNLFILIIEHSTLKANAGEFVRNAERIQSVLQHIHDNFSTKLDSDHLAKLLSLSKPRFYEVFRDVMGVSPGRHIQNLRMKKAQELLMTTELRVYEIAQQVGYEDSFHFSRLFKKNYRVSPENFRHLSL